MTHSFYILSEDHSAEELEGFMKAQLAEDSAVEVALEEEAEGTRSLDPSVLVAIVGGGVKLLTTALTSLVSIFLAEYKGKADKSNRQIVLKGKNGREIQIPADTPTEKIQEYIQLVKELEMEELEYVSVESS